MYIRNSLVIILLSIQQQHMIHAMIHKYSCAVVTLNIYVEIRHLYLITRAIIFMFDSDI